MPSQWHGSASIVAQNCVAYLFPDVLMTGVFVKPKYLVFMRNVMKYLGIMSVSLACAGPLFATSVQPFAGVTVVQQSVVTVKGQVVDEKGEPIIGANVIVEGTTNGMITDLDGNFSLQCPVGSTLKTSYIGYLARTVKVTGNMNALKITLKEDTDCLLYTSDAADD